MQVLLIRHGVAEEQDDFAKTGAPDDERPLTADGRAKLREAVPGLKRLVPAIDVLATSPLTRAVQTADIVADAYPDATRETIDAMSPGAPFDDFIAWLLRHGDRSVVAAVGHNPHISDLANRLTGDDDIDMKKGSALLLVIPDAPGSGRASLAWSRTAKELADSRRP